MWCETRLRSRAPRSSLLVVTIPPCPVVLFLLAKKLKAANATEHYQAGAIKFDRSEVGCATGILNDRDIVLLAYPHDLKYSPG